MADENAHGFDVVVLGSGAAGFAAAVTAAAGGAKVLLIEKAEVVGGTSAWSGGWIWAPRNPLAVAGGIDEPAEAPRAYLEAVCGNHFDAARIDAFLAAVPEMVGFFHERTALKFDGPFPIPDTYGHLPGAGTGGRSVIAKPFDARRLGRAAALLRRPLRETAFAGMTIQAGADLRAFMTMTRSAKSFVHVLARHARDLAVHRRGMDLRNGNALIGRLLRSALDLGVEIRTGTEVASLVSSDAGVAGVRLASGAEIAARRGVVLACGGFPRDEARRREVFPRPDEHLTLAVPTADGDGARLAEAAGGALDLTPARPAAFCPVSAVPWPDGREGRFPHIIDRGKPGVIGVRDDGRRFCNEGLGYHDYVEALLEATPAAEPARSWLVCDHRFLRRFGLGVVRPSPAPWRGWLKNGYLKTGETPAALARACGIDPAGLEATLADWNAHAVRGEDPAFGRGATPYMRLQGDPDQRPNPCVAPIATPPFYAVEVRPGGFGAFAGLKTDARGAVLDAAGAAIPGLFAAGADAASVFGGFYPAGGINLGPALTFGYIVGRNLARAEDAT